MEILITKGETADVIEVLRDDGSVARTELVHKGAVPHDAVHFFVESSLNIDGAFWGMIAKGRHPEEIQDLAKAAGHASAARPGNPDSTFVQALQAERIVECFEADLWGGGGDCDTFRHLIGAGCQQSRVPDLPLSDDAIDRIRSQIADFRDRWAVLPVGASYRLEWRGAA